ncbi:hypothetical protein EIP86_000488 [Pleurotus ostreatoroseus]|nr:hypothetical protein EIP86_000488 [Pleurotus ostreatoroseus]
MQHSASLRSNYTSPGYGQRYQQTSGGYPPAGRGYGQGPPPPPPRAPTGPPPGADPQLWQWFNAVDADRSGSISVTELQAALVNGNWTRFDLDTVKMLMNIFVSLIALSMADQTLIALQDTDRSGTIGFSEFAGLWKYISDWQNVFRHFDRDRSGSIDGHELADALRNFGYNLSPLLLQLLEQKYASGPGGYGTSTGITFDRFVRACVVVKTLTEAFQK